MANFSMERVPKTFPYDFPPELLKTIFSYSSLVPLMHLSATCHKLRYHIHDLFKHRIQVQAGTYPEIRDSLARIGWNKDHDPWTCNCFQIMAGPGFTWWQLDEHKRFSAPCANPEIIQNYTTVADKTFVLTLFQEIRYWIMSPRSGNAAAPRSGNAAAPGNGNAAAPGSGNAAAPGSGHDAAPGSGNAAAPGSGNAAAPGSGNAAAPGSGNAAAPGNGNAAEHLTPGGARSRNCVKHKTLVSGNEYDLGYLFHRRHLTSYDNVLVFTQRRIFPFEPTCIFIFNPSTFTKVSEIDLNVDLNDDEAYVRPTRRVVVDGIALARDTMVVRLDYEYGNDTRIQIWRINTKDPREQGIALVNVMSHLTAPLSKYLPSASAPLHLQTSLFQTFCVNDRYIVILDHDQVKVFSREKQDLPLVCQITIESNKHLTKMAIQGERGDRIALALMNLNAVNGSKLVVRIYKASEGDLIIQKEFDVQMEMYMENEKYFPFYLQWFGHHLVLVSQQGSMLSLFTWQPNLKSFLKCPFQIPVVRSSPRGLGMWVADCLHVDFQGVTTAIHARNSDQFEPMIFFQTWESSS